ncbi:MAG: alkaline phosphatase family protein [Chthonomonadales bacterium]
MDPRIKHIIVLMLENRSFDHMLGHSGLPGTEPLTGTSRTNNDDDGEPVSATPDADYSGDFDPDPGHDFSDVNLQLFGTHTPSPGQPVDMSGFVRSYAEKCGGNVPQSRRIMKGFARSRIPALVTLAENFALCNRWFSSVPGPTLPNRLFAHCGTSGGRLDMSPEYFSGFRTVYEVLDRSGVSAAVYSGGWSSTATFSFLLKNQGSCFATLEDFYSDCDGDESDIPPYCFLEPRYSSGFVNGSFLPQNDQHPDSDVRQGDKLVYNVYKAIRKNRKLWESSILVITYDEHGGMYDHVAPGPITSPDGKTDLGFDFTRLGVRVPAVIVSPYISPSTVSSLLFDHTSLIATARRQFTGVWQDEALGKRAAAANTFTVPSILNSPILRLDDVPIADPAPPPPSQAELPLNDLQRQHLVHAVFVESQLPPHLRTSIDPRTISTDHEADSYCSRVYALAGVATGGRR